MKTTLRIPLLAAALCLLAAAQAHAGGESWVTDWEAAKARAKAENKDLLVDFTGSDWCGWCIKLRNEVFEHEEFDKPANEMFVLVELDYPRRTDQPEELKKQNEVLKNQFKIRGYPTIYLCNADGHPYSQTGYRPGGPAPYIEHLRELRAEGADIKAALREADAAQGLERSRKLDSLLDLVGEELALGYYRPMMDEAIRLDPDNAAGVRGRREAVLLAKEQEDRMNTVMRDIMTSLYPRTEGEQPDYAGALKKIGELEAAEGSLDDPKWLRIHQSKAQALAALGRHDEAIACLDKTVANEKLSPVERDRALTSKVQILTGADRKDEALSLLDELVQNAFNASMQLSMHMRTKARILAETGDADGAIELAGSEADRLRGLAIQMMTYEATLMADQGRKDDAIAICREALEINGDERLKPLIESTFARIGGETEETAGVLKGAPIVPLAGQ